MSGKNRLVNAHILLQCSDAGHGSTCLELRDALIDGFNEVKKASTVTQVMGDGDFCVEGVAKIDPKKRGMFEDALRNLRAGSKKRSGVRAVQVDLEVQ